MAGLAVIPAPAGWRFQPIDAGEVAAQRVKLALGTPARLVPDIAGPKVYSADELLRAYLWATHQHRPIMPVWLPGKAARFGPAPTWPPTKLLAAEPGKSSLPTR